MTRVLLCRHCGEWYHVARVIPDICPHCDRSALWTTEAPSPTWTLTTHDEWMLRVLGIATT